MAATTYHDLGQPYRIQKRLALNQCFRAIQERYGLPARFAYVTFGGADLYDVMDLLAVFSVRDHEVRIVSYEHDPDTAELCQDCPVATTLSQVATITVEIVAAPFPAVVEKIEALRDDRQFIYFLDYTGTFRDKEANDLASVLTSKLLRIGDFLLITSCLTPRVVHNTSIMAKYDQSFRLLFGRSKIDKDFRGRNHVDLLVALVFSRNERQLRSVGEEEVPTAKLLLKFRYRDSRSPMGLWLYRIERKGHGAPALSDVPFDEFPHAFEMLPVTEVPNIFD